MHICGDYLGYELSEIILYKGYIDIHMQSKYINCTTEPVQRLTSLYVYFHMMLSNNQLYY